MKTERITVRDNGDSGDFDKSPLPLKVIPNNMGINLSSVDSVVWQKQDDGQLTSLTIYFIPALSHERPE